MLYRQDYLAPRAGLAWFELPEDGGPPSFSGGI
jgi:hypothetical protein